MTPAWEGNRCTTASVDETLALGRALGRSLVAGLTMGLVGPLGAGKTQLVKGVALGNGLADARQVTSPTFTLIHEYEGKLPLFHLDAYRLSKPEELAALGFDELVESSAVVAVEWADRVAQVMPDDTLWIELGIAADSIRDFIFRTSGPISGSCFDAVRGTRR